MRRLCLLSCLLLPFGVSTALACSPETPPGQAPETVRAAEIRDGGILVLTGGGELRLAPVAVPRRTWRGRKSIRPIRDLAARAEARLSALTLGRDLVLAHEVSPDRYGRRRAQLFRPGTDGSLTWIQAELVRAGLGRVESESDTRVCARELLAVEARARARKKGLWQLDLFAVRNVKEVRKRTGSYQIVEGRIRTIAEAGGRIYLNFGEDWRRDFTISIPPKSKRLFEETFRKDRTGRRVRVRGWVERYNGPLIEATHPEQLEWPEEKGAEAGEPPPPPPD